MSFLHVPLFCKSEAGSPAKISSRLSDSTEQTAGLSVVIEGYTHAFCWCSSLVNLPINGLVVFLAMIPFDCMYSLATSWYSLQSVAHLLTGIATVTL